MQRLRRYGFIVHGCGLNTNRAGRSIATCIARCPTTPCGHCGLDAARSLFNHEWSAHGTAAAWSVEFFKLCAARTQASDSAGT